MEEVQSLYGNRAVECINPLLDLAFTNCMVLLTYRMIELCK
jgi:hypothetical protein